MKSVAKITLFVTLFGLFISGCAVQPQLSPVQKRQLTTKLFDSSYETTYRAILTVLQDQGYIIKNTDMNTGLINATVDRKLDTDAQVAQVVMFGAYGARGLQIDASFMVNKISESRTEVRLNMQETKYGQTSIWTGTSQKSVKQILEPEIYNQLFNEIRTEIKRREAMEG